MWQIVRRQLRRPMMPILVICQVALACAITCNALFLLQQELTPVLSPDGINNPAHLVFVHNIAARGDPWPAARMREVTTHLSAFPDVNQVSYAATLPMLSMAQWTQDLRLSDGGKVGIAVYFGDALVKSLGLHVIAGRDFNGDEESETLQLSAMSKHEYPAVIITEALAQRLFPKGNAVGNLLPESNSRVVGVVAHLIRNNLGQNYNGLEDAIIVPGIVQGWAVPMFAVRVAGDDTSSACKKLVAAVGTDLGADLIPGDQIQCDSYPKLRSQMLAGPVAAVWLLAGVTSVVLIVTLGGIVGMMGYWIQQRTRSIGICRALGAQRSDVVREILFENLVVVGAGTAIGLIAAYGVNVWLIRHYELSRLPSVYFPMGAILLLGLAQLAALAPARRASHISPIAATRAV